MDISQVTEDLVGILFSLKKEEILLPGPCLPSYGSSHLGCFFFMEYARLLLDQASATIPSTFPENGAESLEKCLDVH